MNLSIWFVVESWKGSGESIGADFLGGTIMWGN